MSTPQAGILKTKEPSLGEWNPEIKPFELYIFPTKYVVPKNFKFSHWPSKKERFVSKISLTYPGKKYP